jgi:ribosomal protein L29
MAKMTNKKQSITDISTQDLTANLAKQREELRHLRFASAGSRPKDSSAPKKARKEIARILTELHFRNIATLITDDATVEEVEVVEESAPTTA